VPPVLLVLIARGLPIPQTELDERLRESMQARQWVIVAHNELSFARIRSVYRPHVRYLIPQATYHVTHPVTIEAGSEVTIEKGCIFEMDPKCGFLVRGKLVARGEEGPDKTIQFRPASPGGWWGNISFWEGGLQGSVLEHCTLTRGSGRRAAGSDSGRFILDESGATNGGGVLIFNSKVNMSYVSIEQCKARNGGGLYIRNTPDQAGLPGSVLIDVEVTNCVAEQTDRENRLMAAGGGVYVQRSYPNFQSCRFTDNHVRGDSSCGGGAYLGIGSRARFDKCVFSGNTAEAEGGGVYAYDCLDNSDDFLGGLTFRGGSFENNSACGSGGGLSAANTRVRLEGVSF
jgi:predicted outer membrane repeat protein